MAETRNIYVYYDGEQVESPLMMGLLSCGHLRGKDIFSFEFDKSWLADKRFRSFDPDLQMFGGKQYVPQGKDNFGIFLDSTPDRWGRVLLERKEAEMARLENRKVRNLFETDYLLGVFDGSRMGALRFKIDPEGDFLDNDADMATPPWTSLRDLENASLNLEDCPEVQQSKWLRMLVAPGSSLGGARPKANVLDKDGSLWIAKFPSRKDRRDVGAWEAVCCEMARRSGVNVSDFRIERFSDKYHTFLTKRFDRTAGGKRRQFTSAMTLLGYSDGENSEGASYLEIAEWIERNCMNVNENLTELFRRIVFNIAVSNCDDHLRNHGFMHSPKGWTLSPAYDLTPDPKGYGLKLNISETDNSLDYDLALSITPYLGINKDTAEGIIDKTRNVVSEWRKIATRYGIPNSEQDLTESAFRY